MSGQIHRFFEEKTVAVGDRFELNEDNARIARSVLRLAKGDAVVLLDGRGGIASAEILEISKRDATVTILDTKVVPPPFPEITLLQGLPKGEKSAWIVQKSVEFGVARILFFESGRTIGKKGSGQTGRWQRVAVEAMRQSGNAHLPVIEGPLSLRDALARVGHAGVRLLLDEAEKSRRLREVLGAQTPPAFCVAVGPEGGWSEEDRHELRTRGFQSVGVGPFTLRTETAAVAGLAALRAWLP